MRFQTAIQASLVVFLAASSAHAGWFSKRDRPTTSCELQMRDAILEKLEERKQLHEVYESLTGHPYGQTGVNVESGLPVGTLVGCIAGIGFSTFSAGSSLALCAGGIGFDALGTIEANAEKKRHDEANKARQDQAELTAVERIELKLATNRLVFENLKMVFVTVYAGEVRGLTTSYEDSIQDLKRAFYISPLTDDRPFSKNEMHEVARKVRENFGTCENRVVPTLTDVTQAMLEVHAK